jgi:hypothetical protein
MMGIGVSLILAAAGAILIWAVDVTVSGVDLTTVGVILLVVGCVGAVLSLVFWSSWGGFGGSRTESRTTNRLTRWSLGRAPWKTLPLDACPTTSLTPRAG